MFDEAIVCLRANRGRPEEIVKQMRFLISEQFPDDIGLKETCIVFRNHGAALVRDFDSLWWSVLSNGSTRDQLGCDYSIWKTKISFVPFSDKTLLSRCQHRHRPDAVRLKKLSFFAQCYRRFYLVQALYLYMKHKFKTTFAT